MKKKRLGDDLLNLEKIVDKMIDDHDLQWGDLFGLIRAHLEIHRPDAQEEYSDGTTPVFYYGHKRYGPKGER